VNGGPLNVRLDAGQAAAAPAGESRAGALDTAPPAGESRAGTLDTAGLTSALGTAALREALDRDGYAVTPPLIDGATCAELAALYEAGGETFRSTVIMARHGYGRGEYRYFARPLPAAVAALRREVYAALAPVANAWAARLARPPHPRDPWPPGHDALVARCAAAGQTRPTPLLLRYGPGDYNCLHQDLYGAIHFPLQAILLLDRPGADFDGGELILVEQRPRRQSRPMVVPIAQGAFAIVPVKERPIETARGAARVQMRHGVSVVRRGLRRTLGLIFHDAA
jgi:hypothetical protein